MESRFLALETYDDRITTQICNGENTDAENSNKKPYYVSCTFCSGAHITTKCKSFVELSDQERFDRAHKWCKRCLRDNHNTNECRQTNVCEICEKVHHTLIHVNGMNENTKVTTKQNYEQQNDRIHDNATGIRVVYNNCNDSENRN